MSQQTVKFIRRDLEILEGFVVGLDSLPENTARQRRALDLIDSIRQQLKTLNWLEDNRP